MRWIYMMTKMRRMRHGRSRDFPEWNGCRSFPGRTDSDRDRTDNGKTETLEKERALSAWAVYRPVRFRQSAIENKTGGFKYERADIIYR